MITYQNVANVFLCGAFVIPSMHCRKSLVFFGPVVSRPVTLLKIYSQTHVRKCKNAMPKSRQILSSLLSIVDYIFFNLFLVVHLRKKYYFGKEKQYSIPKSAVLEQFYWISGHAILCMANVTMNLISGSGHELPRGHFREHILVATSSSYDHFFELGGVRATLNFQKLRWL